MRRLSGRAGAAQADSGAIVPAWLHPRDLELRHNGADREAVAEGPRPHYARCRLTWWNRGPIIACHSSRVLGRGGQRMSSKALEL